MTIHDVIQWALLLLIIVGIAAVARLFIVLGDVRKTLAGVDQTRQELGPTIEKLNTTVETLNGVLKDEVAPTLHTLRATLSHVETVTRVVSNTSEAAQRVVGTVESALNVTRMLSAGKNLLVRRGGKGKAITGYAPQKKGGGLSLLTGVASGVMGLARGFLAQRNATGEPIAKAVSPPAKTADKNGTPALPAKPPANEVISATAAEREAVKARQAVKKS